MGDENLGEKFLAERFESERGRLRAVAYRMLGSTTEAEDAVQEAWLRLHLTQSDAISNLQGWLTTVVARVCLDMLRTRRTRREESGLEAAPEPSTADAEDGGDPERQAQIADAVGAALLVVLETLGPAERVAFVLHDLFDLPFEQIAPIVGRTPTAARQLASRARRRVQGAPAPQDPDRSRRREVVEAFLAASGRGDFEGLLALLDPDVVFRADAAAAALGASPELHGAAAVAQAAQRRSRAAEAALVDGEVAVTVAPEGRLLLVLRITIVDGRITAVEAVADPARLGRMKVERLAA